MIKHALLFFLLIYLISCTSNDKGLMQAEGAHVPKPIRTSLLTKKSTKLKIDHFNSFLSELPFHQMIYASETDLHERIESYLADSTISKGYDLHIREIGRIDTFIFVFHEYFDLYDDWSKTYLNVFSPTGQLLQTKRIWDLSFEGNTSINFINKNIIEIAYHDFFDPELLETHSIIPAQHIYLKQSSKVNNRIEGTVYEYYNMTKEGQFKNLSQHTKISEGRYFPQSSAKLLTRQELLQYSTDEVQLMKDELLAEHGFIFSDLSTYNYFKMQAWYLPEHENVDSLLTDIEKLNLACLSTLEKEL